MEAELAQPGPQMKRTRGRSWRRWLAMTGMGLVVVLLGAYLIVPRMVTPLVRDQLQQVVAEHLNAELTIGEISWSFPRTVTLKDAALVARTADGAAVELLKIPRLRIELRRLPSKTTPLIIERLDLDGLAVHLINTPAGWVGGRNTGVAATQPAPLGGGAAGRPLSQIFELRQVKVSNARIVYEDRTRPETVPLVWRGIDLTLNTDPAANPVYQFQLSAQNAPLADVAAGGSFHIDDLDVSIDQLAANLRSDPDSGESPAPARLQELLQRHQVRGRVAVNGTARLPLKQYQRSTFDFVLKLEEASLAIPSEREPAEVDRLEKVSLSVRVASHALSVHQDLATTAQRLQVMAATAPATQRSVEEELAQTAAELAGGPATQAATTQDAAQPQAAQPQAAQTQPDLPPDRLPLLYARLENARAEAGDNVVTVELAGITYNWLERRWQGYARGALVSGREHGALPGALEKIAENLDAEGVIEVRVRGDGRLPPKGSDAKADYTVDVRATSARLLSRKRAVTLTEMAADFLVVPGAVHLREEGAGGVRHGLVGRAYGGTIQVTGQMRTSRPAAYDLGFVVKDVDLKALSEERLAAGHDTRLSGKLSGATRLAGFAKFAGVSLLETVHGEGEMEIVGGEFYHLPVLADIFQTIKPNAEGGTVGQAAGIFTIADRKIRFGRAAVSSPALGVQGSGVADFEGRLDFEVVAAPLADWRKRLQKANIPIIGNVAAELVGGIQNLLDTASGKLLYQFRISGSVKAPRVQAVPAPLITDNVIKLFGAMIKGGDHLLDQVKGTEGKK